MNQIFLQNNRIQGHSLCYFKTLKHHKQTTSFVSICQLRFPWEARHFGFRFVYKYYQPRFRAIYAIYEKRLYNELIALASFVQYRLLLMVLNR